MDEGEIDRCSVRSGLFGIHFAITRSIDGDRDGGNGNENPIVGGAGIGSEEAIERGKTIEREGFRD